MPNGLLAWSFQRFSGSARERYPVQEGARAAASMSAVALLVALGEGSGPAAPNQGAQWLSLGCGRVS
jgi:hypothetical protein